MNSRGILRLGVLVVITCYLQAAAQKLDIPPGTQWLMGETLGCPKVPNLPEECSAGDIRCYTHGGGVHKPCYDICPPQDSFSIAQKCKHSAFCGEYLDKYCVPLAEVPTTTTESDGGTTDGSKQKFTFGVYIAIIVPVIIVVGIAGLLAYKFCGRNSQYSVSRDPEGQRPLMGSPSGQSSDITGTPQIIVNGGTNIIQLGDNNTAGTSNPGPSTSADPSAPGGSGDLDPAAQPPPAGQPPSPPAADDEEPRMDDLSTTPIRGNREEPLSQEESSQPIQVSTEGSPQPATT